jgi:hypothetical protein
MLELIIAGYSVPLFPNTRIQLEYQSPMFDEDVVKGSRTMPFDLPITDITQAIFGAPENLQSAGDRQKTYTAELYDAGKLVIRGYFRLRTPSTKKYSGNITESDGGVSAALGDKLLNELSFGSDTLPTVNVNSGAWYVPVKEYTAREGFTQSVYRFHFYYGAFDVTADFAVSTAATLSDLATQINATAGLPAKGDSSGNVLIVLPDVPGTYAYSFRVELPDQAIFDGPAIALQQLFYDTIAPFPNATLGNSSATGHYVFPMVKNPSFYGEENPTFSGYVNEYDVGYQHNPITDRTRSTLVPFFFLNFVLKKLFELAGYEASGEFFEDVTLDRLIIYNTHSLDRKLPDPAMLFNIYQNVIRYADHLPVLKVSEFLNEIRSTFCLGYFFDARLKTVQVKFLRDIIGSVCQIDWTAKAVPDHDIDQDEATDLQLAFALDSEDEAAQSGDPVFAPYGTGEVKEFKFSPLVSETVPAFPFSTGAANITLPLAKQKGISPFLTEQGSFGNRLLFWHGLDPMGRFPLASSERDGYKFQWNGAGGLYDRFWKQYQLFRKNTFQVKKSFELSADDIYNFDFTKKRHVRGVNFFVTKITVTVPITKPAQLILLAAR